MSPQFDMPVISPVYVDTTELSWIKKVFSWILITRKWKFEADWYFLLPGTDGIVAFIPKENIFDGASIPKLFRNIISPTGFLFISSIFHDFGYKNKFLYGYYADMNFEDDPIKIPGLDNRKAFDQLLRDVAIYTSGYTFLSKSVYQIINASGWKAWNNHRKNDEEDNG